MMKEKLDFDENYRPTGILNLRVLSIWNMNKAMWGHSKVTQS